ncbi:putative signaling protein [bioreactor metagenome]|uniref:Putative signaling protein n=1 Tax=bioreactor metagenome TaxID=1076179 RepID=A0A645A8U0_9ZZZZ
MAKAGRRLGFLSFTRNESLPGRDEPPTLLLSIAANAIADTLVRLEDNRKIEWTAYHDGLTGLPNRLLFGRRLDQAIAQAEEAGGALGVAYVDLDSFKSINDTIGHQAGNQLIIDAASQLSGCTREGDCAARFGGDEFVLLLHVSGVDELTEKVQAVLSAVQKPIALCGQDYFITCSIGVALYPRDGTDARALLKNADLAMYQAKSQGKNQFALCSQLLKDRVRDSTRLTNLLFRALERSQLLVYYQPQVSLQSRQIVGLEALLRWRLPEEGFVGPQVFIPLAEQTGLIYSIGAWVLETACRDCRRWQDMGFPALRVAVNISVQQIENKQFSALVAETLERTGLASGHLELEVTESVANSRAVNMVERMNQLKALGVSLSIDDFGTGYSSLERLKLMPIDRIKMDIQFVQGIEKSEKDRAIAQVIIDLAKSLDMKVIAEGVETEEQLDFLRQRACDEVQGYYYYKPLPAPELEELLRIQPPLNHNAALAGQN